ncbi:MAG: protein containing YHS domain protein [Nitrospirae bacterium]|nr:protein containing YHS domain protein [Nitrospirota bacterium]
MTLDPVSLRPIEKHHAAPAIRIYGGHLYYFDSLDSRAAFDRDPERYVANAPGRTLTVGVMGAASGQFSPEVTELARETGRAIARKRFGLITGACPGLPWEACKGFKEVGGFSVGISPALSEEEHLHRFHSPNDLYDMIIFTGSGLMGREVINIRSSDFVIILGGHSGTLGEFSIAYDEGKLIGVVEGSGGITTILDKIVEAVAKPTGSTILRDSSPEALLDRMIDHYTTTHFRKPSVFIG